MKSVRLLLAVCISSMLFVASAYCQTTDTNKPATTVKPKAKQAEGLQKSTPLKPRTPKKKPARAKQTRRSDVPDIPLTNARIAFDHNVFNFGVVPKGVKVTHHFPVSNIGPDTLIITKIKAG